LKKLASALQGAEKQKAMTVAENQKDMKLYRSHFGFIAQLSLYLNDSQIETVKDVLTYNVVKVTYDAQCDMIPTLKTEEKAQILAWLKEAREYAIDAESSNKKHETFGKYKGRINNYLSKRGYDLTKEREEWAKRVKARGGTL
jgi:virulence-associated protein VapD